MNSDEFETHWVRGLTGDQGMNPPPVPPEDPDTRKPLDSGFMQQQRLADESAKANTWQLPDFDELKKANETFLINAAMEHARNIPGVEYTTPEEYITTAAQLYGIMVDGFPTP